MRSALLYAGLLLSELGCSETPSSVPTASQAVGGTEVSGASSEAGGTASSASASSQAGTPTLSMPDGGGAGGATSATSGGQSQVGGSSGGQAGGPNSRCDPDLSASNRATVAMALDALFVDKHVSTIDQYWAEPYLQHNPVAKSGVAAFKSIMGSLVTSPSFSFERLRILAECDLVVLQGRYSGTGVIFDMFRVEGGRLVEHWDSDANQASDASGTTDSPQSTETDDNRAKVLAFIQTVLIASKHAEAAQFLSPTHVEHRAAAASGPAAFIEYVTADGVSYSKVHHVIADGSFVFTLSQGTLGTIAYGFYDLFRLEGGQIVEHWDSRRRVPSSTMSGLGIF